MGTNLGDTNLQTALETLLNEFYSPTSSNERKRQIEHELEVYRNVTIYFDFLSYDLQSVNNTFVWFFKVSCLEDAIIKENLDLVKQKQLSNILWTGYKNIPENSSKIQRDKLAQLLVHLLLTGFQINDEVIFLDEILRLIENKFQFGVVLLRTLSEEIFSTRSNICVKKKEFIKMRLSHKLKPVSDYFRNYISHLCDYINDQKLCMLRLADEPVIEFLSCVQHLLSWIDLEDFITALFMEKLFLLSNIRFTRNQEISIAAVTTICELFYRQALFSSILPSFTLRNITELLCEIKELPTLENESYLEKVTELLTLYVSKPFEKFHEEKEFESFLIRVKHFTTDPVHNSIMFSRKIIIWNTLLNNQPDNIHSQMVVVKILGDLATYILKTQILFIHDSHAEFLDNTEADDDNLTEWQRFVTPCIELIVKVLQKQPCNFIRLLIEHWNLILNHLNTNINQLASLNGAQMLRNLSTLCQIFCQMRYAINEPYLREMYIIILNLDRPLELFSALYGLPDQEYEGEAENFVAQYLSTVRCYIPVWDKELLSNEIKVNIILNMVLHYITEKWNDPKAIQFEAAQLFQMLSSSIRLKFILNDEKVQSLLNANYQIDEISQKLLQRKTGMTKCLHNHVPILVFQSLCNILLLPWINVPANDQMFEERNLLFNNFIQRLASCYLRVDLTAGAEGTVSEATIKCIPILSEILEYFQDSNNLIKSRIMRSYEPVIVKTISILNFYDPNRLRPMAFNSIIEFAKSMIITLQNQLSVTFIKELVDTILNGTMKVTDARNQFRCVEKILQILTYIIEKPGNISNTMFPCAIRFALDHVMPKVQMEEERAKDIDNVVVSTYVLLDSILQNKWNHFYNPQVLNKPVVNGDVQDTMPYEDVKYEEDFVNIFTAYGYGLISWKDPEVKNIILVSMFSLNERKRLFSRESFRRNCLHHFLNTFLKTIMLAEGNLHFDILVSIIFAIGQVDKILLRHSLIGFGYSESSEIIGNLLNATDLPTFSYSMTKLVYDTKLYTNYNHFSKTMSNLEIN